MKEKIKAFGGILDKRVSGSKTLAVIATKEAMETDFSKYIKSAEEKNVQVVSPQVLDNVGIEGILSNVKTHTISSWGSDPKKRFVEEKPEVKKSGSEMFKKDMTKSIKMKVKGGGARSLDYKKKRMYTNLKKLCIQWFWGRWISKVIRIRFTNYKYLNMIRNLDGICVDLGVVLEPQLVRFCCL